MGNLSFINFEKWGRYGLLDFQQEVEQRNRYVLSKKSMDFLKNITDNFNDHKKKLSQGEKYYRAQGGCMDIYDDNASNYFDSSKYIDSTDLFDEGEDFVTQFLMQKLSKYHTVPIE